MDFLTTALFNLEDELSGAILTSFDPNNLTARAGTRFVPVDKLKSGEGIEPCGFKVSADGVLLSDTTARKDMDKFLVDYIGIEVGRGARYPDFGLIDVVLYAASNNAGVYIENGEGGEPYVIPMSSFKVSHSSFNIYAPYKNADGEYRTFSLMDIEKDTHIPFTLAVPSNSVASLSLDEGPSVVSRLPSLASSEQTLEGYTLYHVDVPLVPAPSVAGEAFVNYLAYNVGFQSIGLEIMNMLIDNANRVTEDTPTKQAPDEYRQRKVPAGNFTVESMWKHNKLAKVLNVLDDEPKLVELIRREHEAYISLQWLQTIFNNSDDTSTDGLASTCLRLRYDCKLALLHYSLELLSQRYSVYKLFPQNHGLPVILRGGGVHGEAKTISR